MTTDKDVIDALEPGERHELECLRARVQQLDYPCSPHCDGYLREMAQRERLRALEAELKSIRALDSKAFDKWATDRAALEAELEALRTLLNKEPG